MRIRSTSFIAVLAVWACVFAGALCAQVVNNPPIVASASATSIPWYLDIPSTLTVSASDPEGDPMTYLWEYVAGTAGTIASPTASVTTFTPAGGVGPTTSLLITVSDNQGNRTVTPTTVFYEGPPVECFAAGTPVATASGRRPIESIKAGEFVWACDVSTGNWALHPVVQTFAFTYWNDDVVTIRSADETITATGPHPFWVLEGENLSARPPVMRLGAQGAGSGPRWVEARDLKLGDVIPTYTGGRACIDEVSCCKQRLNTFDLHVAVVSTYAVGTIGMLVHNSWPSEDAAACSLINTTGGVRFYAFIIVIGWVLLLILAACLAHRRRCQSV